MRRITLSALALFVVGATSCSAYDDPGYQNPPGTPPDYDYRGQPSYQSPQPPPPDYRGDYQQPYPQSPYDSRDDQGYYDPYRRSPSWEVGFFYNELSPYGEWVFTYDYGWAWYPRNVRAGWRPYYYGRWVPSDYGWLWVSYEPFGWATYHYGRWAWDPRLGWIWLPGRTWGPAWVSWQYGQGYIGWAPLPPEVGFQVGFGLNIGGFSLSVGIRPDHYTFVGDRYFLENEPFQYAAPVVQNTTIIKNTTNITNYTYIDNRVINKGVEIERVERATGKRVRPLRVAETTSEQSAKVSGEQVVVYKAPREKVETVQVDDSKPRKKGYGRERAQQAQREQREQPPGQERRAERQQQPPAQQPEMESRQPRREERVQMTPPADLEVAPRARQDERGSDERQVRQQQAKQQQDLRSYQREEKQKLERSQQEEKQKARGQEAQNVARRHEQEKQQLEQQQKQEEQQLQAKQEVERKAAKAKPPGKSKAEEQKEKEKGKKKPQAEEPPPPHR